MAEGTSLTSPAPVRRGRALGWLSVIAFVYVLALWYVDRDKHVLSRLSQLAAPLCGCVVLVLCSYLVRYQRWHTVLRAQGHRVPWRSGLYAYLAGFAFTASPGKAGELLRIRYFSRLGVPASVTLATFIYERALDLLIIAALATLAAQLVPLFGALVGVVLALVLALFLLAYSRRLQAAASLVAPSPGVGVRRLAVFLLDGIRALRPLLRPGLTLGSAAYGSASWLLTSAAFAWLCRAQGIDLTWQHALAIYPMAMLVGALSFVPGGVGTTEAAIVLMLASQGVALDVALTVAIGIRLASLWLAVAIGMLAMTGLETRAAA